jgi:FlaA1/EpsC-like NDP-sugar epimerase
MFKQALGWSRPLKKTVVIVVDMVLAMFSTWLAYSLRFETLHWPRGQEWGNYALSPLFAVLIFWAFGLYRAVFRYFGSEAMLQTARAVLCYAVVLIGYHLWQIWPTFPLTLGIVQPIIFMLLLAASRVFAQFWLAGMSLARQETRGRLLIYGAGEAGAQIANALAVTGQFKLLGFLDDDKARVGQTINGVPVFAASAAPDTVRKLEATDIVLALPSATRERRNQIITRIGALQVHTRTLPSLHDLTSGRVSVQDLHELDVEDLLGRDTVAPDAALLASKLHRQVVLVTGAGGTIGGELCRQILREHPQRLLLLEHNEFGLYTIHRELQRWCHVHAAQVELVPLLASVANRRRLDWVLSTYQPSVIYHAAAYKHVPMVECNPSEGIFNNVFGTLNVVQAALAAQVAHFVLVSTDKAVRPTNLMGASKRMAELILQAMAQQAHTHHTSFCMVRFGNVLGSSGSVVPMFREQLGFGGPLTITHPEVTRYFMTIPEAAQLVLQAAAMSTGGDVFVLKMGEPVKIIDLARRLVSLAGLKVRDAQQPDGDIELQIVGLRPGEKLYEELLIGNNPTATAHPRIMTAHEDFMPWPELEIQLTQLHQAAATEDEAAIRVVLQNCVHGFHEEPAA